MDGEHIKKMGEVDGRKGMAEVGGKPIYNIGCGVGKYSIGENILGYATSRASHITRMGDSVGRFGMASGVMEAAEGSD